MNDFTPIVDQSLLSSGKIIIAGPCSAESLEQVTSTALSLAAGGIKIFRAGIWKPRTRPGSFEGVGEQGLPWLAKVKELTSMAVATEVATERHVRLAIEAGVDILWLGARTSANPFAVQEIADAIAAEGADRVAVLVKNPVSPDLELWIGAIQRLCNAGIKRIAAVHRGFSSYGQHLYRNIPYWQIPLELRRRLPNLPIICDPSHIGGRRDLVRPVSQEALDMGFDGLIIESHCNPDNALSDASQQLTPDTLLAILSSLNFRTQTLSDDNLLMLRHQIDAIDNELIAILEKRMAVSREIGRFKKEHGVPVVQPARYDDIMDSRIKAASTLGMSPEFMRSLLAAIHAESVRQQLSS